MVSASEPPPAASHGWGLGEDLGGSLEAVVGWSSLPYLQLIEMGKSVAAATISKKLLTSGDFLLDLGCLGK